MRNFTFTEKQYADLKHIFMVDNANIADNPEFFKEVRINPKRYIDQRIELCSAFDIDCWNTVELFSPRYHLQRLKALYNGQSLKEFEKKHKRPSPAESEKQILGLFENKEENFENNDN